MSKATFIWFGGPEKPFRSFSFNKRLVYFGLAGVALLLLCTFVLSLTLYVRNDEYSKAFEKNDEISRAISEKESKIKELELKNRELDESHQKLSNEMMQTHEMEKKLKKLLGLPENLNIDKNTKNQGGLSSTGISVPADPKERELIQKSFDSEAADRIPFQKLLSYLENKNLGAGIPTLLPVKYDSKLWISSDFGWRHSPYNQQKKSNDFHYGIDIVSERGTKVIAPADGVVSESAFDKEFGNFVKIRHANGVETLFGHMAKNLVKTGSKIKRGEVLGLMGDTGRSTGVHLHYAVIVNGHFVDPAKYIWNKRYDQIARM